MEYVIHLLILIGIYLILAQSFNLTFGVGRLFNLAHVAAYAIGAYVTALGSTRLEYDFFECVVSSMLLSGLLSLFIGGISLRLSQDYFAIGTLAFSSVINALLINWKSVTNGVLGVPGIPRPELLGLDFYSIHTFVWLIVAAVLVSQVFFYLLLRSSYARSLRAQAESEQVTLSLGRNTVSIRTFSFFISSCFGGLAGCLFAYYINYIDPSSFTLSEMIFVLTIVVVGRPGSFWGVTAAAAFLVLLPELPKFLEIRPDLLGPMRQLLHALILFGVVYVQREKLFPRERRV